MNLRLKVLYTDAEVQQIGSATIYVLFIMRFYWNSRREIVMKWNCPTTQKSKKQQFLNADETFHRFYQPKQWKKRVPSVEKAAIHLAQRDEGRLQQLFQEHWHEISHRPGMERGHLLPQNAQIQRNRQEDRMARASATYPKVQPATRLVWLQQNHLHLPKALGLRTRFTDVGMQVSVQQWAGDDTALLECELILLECFDTFEQEMLKSLLKIRMISQAPLIVLTDNHTLDWSIGALRSGADAIFTVSMLDDVIVARSKALLRRWIVR